VGATAGTGGRSEYEPEEHVRTFLAALFSLAFGLSACGSRSAAAEMAFPQPDWAEATPASQGVNEEKLRAAMEYLKKHTGKDGVREAVVVVNGRVIFKGDNVDHVHGVWSVTKSFTSTVMGLLVADGKCTPDTLAKDYMPAMAARYPRVPVRHRPLPEMRRPAR